MNNSEDFIKKIKGNPQNISLIKMMKIEEMLMKNTKKERADESGGRTFQQMDPCSPQKVCLLTCICRQH